GCPAAGRRFARVSRLVNQRALWGRMHCDGLDAGGAVGDDDDPQAVGEWEDGERSFTYGCGAIQSAVADQRDRAGGPAGATGLRDAPTAIAALYLVCRLVRRPRAPAALDDPGMVDGCVVLFAAIYLRVVIRATAQVPRDSSFGRGM